MRKARVVVYARACKYAHMRHMCKEMKVMMSVCKFINQFNYL